MTIFLNIIVKILKQIKVLFPLIKNLLTKILMIQIIYWNEKKFVVYYGIYYFFNLKLKIKNS